jgi:hypothetical protein
MAARELIAAAALVVSAGAHACLPEAIAKDATVVEGKQFVLAYRTDPAGVPVSAHFALDLYACARGGDGRPEVRRVDATMPAHRHGMNYRPSVKKLDTGAWHYRAEGLLFHMAGRWEYVFELRDGGVSERLTSAVTIR